MSWDDILALHENGSPGPLPAPSNTAVPRPVLAEIAQDVRAASASLVRAGESLAQAGALPPALRSELSADPAYGRVPEREDWFIEPLLTVKEVASILRVSTRAVRRLGIKTVFIGGETRYRQSELREFLRRQESRLR